MNKLTVASADQETVTKVQIYAQSLGCQVVPDNVVQFNKTETFTKKTMAQAEQEAIEQTIVACKGNLSQVSKTLKVGRATLYRKLKEYNIDPKSLKKAA